MLKRYAEGDKAEQNAILSPQGIFHGLAMSYVASGGQTRKELASVLHFPDDDQKLIKDLADLHRDLEATPWYKPAKVTVASAVWIDSTYAEFRKDYVDMLGKGFSASLHAAKFADAAKVSGEVNHWVSQKTHGKITKTVSPDDFQSRSIPGVTINEPALVSVNAVYFKMDWGSRFEKGATKPGPFHVDSATTQNGPDDAPAFRAALCGERGFPVSGDPLHRRPVLDVRAPAAEDHRHQGLDEPGHGPDGHRPQAACRPSDGGRPAADVRVQGSLRHQGSTQEHGVPTAFGGGADFAR